MSLYLTHNQLCMYPIVSNFCLWNVCIKVCMYSMCCDFIKWIYMYPELLKPLAFAHIPLLTYQSLSCSHDATSRIDAARPTESEAKSGDGDSAENAQHAPSDPSFQFHANTTWFFCVDPDCWPTACPWTHVCAQSTGEHCTEESFLLCMD